MQEELFTTTELTSFGNYLLSRERAITALASDEESDVLSRVCPADIPNWKAKFGEAGVSISEGPSQQPEKPRTVVLVDTPLVL